MAKKKAEVEAEHTRYTEFVDQSLAALQANDIGGAVRTSIAAWDFIDGMMQYERRYNKVELESVGAIDIVLDHAPLILDLHSLEQLESLLASQRSVERKTTSKIGERLDAARKTMRIVAEIWDRFARSDDDVPSDEWRRLGCDQTTWDAVIGLWLRIGLLRQSTQDLGSAFRWTTHMDRIANAKCSACGVLASGPKHRLLDDAKCPSCSRRVPFVIISGA